MSEEFVDLDVMLGAPVPFVKFKSKEYFLKPLTVAEVQEYAKDVLVGPALINFTMPKTKKALIKCFETHVVDSDGNLVKFEETNDWPQEAIELFIRKIFKISG